MIDAWGHITPRSWQAEALPLIIDSIRSGERPVLSAVMGAGKSILVGGLCRSALPKLGNGAIVVTAPTERLVKQLSATLTDMCGPGIVGQFYGKKKQPKRQVIVSCNPSLPALTVELAAQSRRCKLLVIDECHRSEADTLKDTVPVLNPASMVGVTATPYRSASSEALSLYSKVVYRYTWSDGIRDGVLVPPRYISYDERGRSIYDAGDTEDAHFADLDEQCLHMIRRHASGPGIISALNIADAEAYAEWLRGQGYEAAAIHSRMKEADQEDVVLRLQHGQLAALVHVSMLSEGVDFPWLRWLCLRRPVGARVRLVQEVGRGGRAYPGKDHFVCLDPHDLIGIHGMAHPEAIGEVLEQEAEKEERKKGENGSKTREALPPGPAIELSTQWAQLLLLSLQEEGIVGASTVADGEWRTRRPSNPQVKTLAKLGKAYARYLPEECRHAVLRMSRSFVSQELQRGAVSDLISVLRAVADTAPGHGWEDRKGWKYPWPDGLVMPALDLGALRGLDAMGPKPKTVHCHACGWKGRRLRHECACPTCKDGGTVDEHRWGSCHACEMTPLRTEKPPKTPKAMAAK